MTFEQKYGCTALEMTVRNADYVRRAAERQAEHDAALARPGRDTTHIRQCDFAVMTADGWK